VAETHRQVYGLHAVQSLVARRPSDIVAAVLLERAQRGGAGGRARHGGGRQGERAAGRHGKRGDDRRGEVAGDAGQASGKGSGRALESITVRLGELGVPVQYAARAELDRLAGGGAHQGVVVEVRAAPEFSLADFEELVLQRGRAVRLLVLDQVEDPRNLGACLRTADAAGVDAVVVPKAHSAKLTATAVKAATGAADTVPLAIVPNLSRALAWLKEAGVWVVGFDSEVTTSLFGAKLEPPVALVLGAEGKGIRRLTRESCDQVLSIPMHGQVESLNVSVASGVVLFELLRQSPL
jgi:23S rRNA (guanosine2251-2'-O)-methyltransferase